MCDQDHFEEDLKKYSRRDIGTLAAGVGAAMMLPRADDSVAAQIPNNIREGTRAISLMMKGLLISSSKVRAINDNSSLV